MRYLLIVLLIFLFCGSAMAQFFGYDVIGGSTTNGANFMRSAYSGRFPFYSYGGSVDSVEWYCNTITVACSLRFALMTDDNNDDPNIQICIQSDGELILSTQDNQWITTVNAFSAHTLPAGQKIHAMWLTDNATSNNILMTYDTDADYILNSTNTYNYTDYDNIPDVEAGNYGFDFNLGRRQSIKFHYTVPITTRTSAFGTGNFNDPDGRSVQSNFAASSKIATPFLATFDGTLTSISFGLGDSGTPDSVYAFIYSDNAGEPDNLIATSTDSMFVTGGTQTIYTAEITADITGGTTYWIGFGNSAGSDMDVSYIRVPTLYSRSHSDLRPFDASWNTGADASVTGELLAIAHYNLDDSIRHLYPIDDGGYSGWPCSATDCWDDVDDPARHDSSGTINSTNSDNDAQSYLLPNWADVGGRDTDIIDSVRVIGVVRRSNDAADNQLTPFIYDGTGTDTLHGTTITGAGFGTDFHFNDTVIAEIFLTAPSSGSWSVEEIDSLQVGLDADVGLLGSVQCTQLHARVYYHVAVSAEVSVRRRKVILGGN